jgi:hypothetical protein
MDHDAWLRHEERVAAIGGDAVDVGLGRNAIAVTGLSQEQLTVLLAEMHERFINGGANLVLVGGVRLYVRRRGRHLDAGTRRDFAEVGWGLVCDLLDKTLGGERPPR